MAMQARKATTTARMVTSLFESATIESDMTELTPEKLLSTMPLMVPPPPQPATPHRRLWWALPILTLAWLVPLAIVISGSLPIQRWETAPGETNAVGPRLSFDGAKRYTSENPFLFVTAFGTQITALESFVGWVDADIKVQTKKQRFGNVNPTAQRRLGFQAMIGAKQIAEYVALKRLGYEVSFKYGAIILEQVICNEAPTADSACKVLEPGNVIDAVNAKPTPTLDVLLEEMKGAQLNSVVTLTIHDLNSDANKSRRDVKVRLIPSPGDPSRAIIGFVPADTRTVEVPFEVDINTDSIGGPSAGLAFTLSLLDELTPGALAGNVKVATTGTIDEDGNVGAIGALHQKAVAVKASGAKVFLVPAAQTEEEIADAKVVAGKSFAVIPVKNLDEALKALQKYGGGLKQ